MKKKKIHIDPVDLSRFCDKELDEKRYDIINEHIKACTNCQKTLEKYQLISGVFNKVIDNRVKEVDFQFLKKQVQAGYKKKRYSSWQTWQNSLKSLFQINGNRLFITAATSVAGLLVFFLSFLGSPAREGVPSAIVSSFSGDVKSLMIMETPKTHQTIIWFRENNFSEDTK